MRGTPSLVFSCTVSAVALAASLTGTAHAQSVPIVDVCTGLRVSLPVLTPVTTATSGLLTGLLSPVNTALNGVLNDVNIDLVGALSGQTIGVTALDTDGNPISASTHCGVATSNVQVDTNSGVAIGGGQITGLGSPGNAIATAVETSAVAIGNGARTTTGAVNATAFGNNASASVSGGVALGAGSVASRAGLGGATEAFSGTAVASTNGAVSVGTTGSERQITNVAGGTLDTDAVNLRQLRSASNSLASGLGGGATFNSVTGVFTGPSYVLHGTTYTNVGSALDALASLDYPDSGFASNNASGAPSAVASGSNAVTGGYGAVASGANSAAFGASSTASATSTTAIGNRATASAANATALGAGSSAGYSSSTAIGAGAATTRSNQVAIGTDTSTYTMRGLTSDTSAAAQQGATRLVTTDMLGNLATSNVDINALSSDVASLSDNVSSLSGDVATLSGNVASLKRDAVKMRTEMRRGVATAMAMTNAPTPSTAGGTSWATNMAVFQGEIAGSFSAAHRFDTAAMITLNGAVAVSPGTGPGVRVGLAGEF